MIRRSKKKSTKYSVIMPIQGSLHVKPLGFKENYGLLKMIGCEDKKMFYLIGYKILHMVFAH